MTRPPQTGSAVSRAATSEGDGIAQRSDERHANPLFTARADWTLTAGSPLARGLPYAFYGPLLLAALVPCAVALLFLAEGLLGRVFFHPLFVMVPAAVASVPLARVWQRHAARRQAVLVEAFPDGVRFSSRRGELVFPIEATTVTLDVREWSHSRTVGHQVWTLLTFRNDESVFTLGTRGRHAPASGRIGMPMHECERGLLEKLAALWRVNVDGPGG